MLKRLKVVNNINQQLDSPRNSALHASTLLHGAAVAGERKMVEWLVKKGAKKDVPNAEGMTPAHVAAQEGHTEVLEALGVGVTEDVNQQVNNPEDLTKHGCTLLYEAAVWGRAKTVRWLLGKGANKNLVTGRGLTPTYMAAQGGHTEVLEALGVGVTEDVNQQVNNPEDLTKHGRTLLFGAAIFGKTKTVRWLLDKGADRSLGCHFGFTPACAAARRGYIDVLEELLGEGDERINEPILGIDGGNILFVALTGEKSRDSLIEVVRCLLQYGADPFHRNAAGQRFSEAARGLQIPEVDALLLGLN